MGKRKRDTAEEHRSTPASRSAKEQEAASQSTDAAANDHVTIQIITGSYERVLHGITAEIPRIAAGPPERKGEAGVTFSDTFLFHAHTSSIRCLALSPPPSPADASDRNQKVLLATGSSDERINLYQLSAAPPPRNHEVSSIPSLVNVAATENPKNRELGSLIHHSGSVTALHFPTRSKLLSSAEDSTIAIVRTRDWTVLSTIKAPIPKAQGRPSGDTVPPGGVPAGVSDFAVHPSMKLMLTVGKGEKCMRLWNLVTGKKAGVLNFGKEILQGVGEGKWASGEGRRVLWNQKGDEFAVGFEKGAVVFGLNSKPKGRILPSPPTKIHQMRYLDLSAITKNSNSKSDGNESLNVLAASTEDGRIMFYSTVVQETLEAGTDSSEVGIPNCRLLGQLGGQDVGSNGRIKDFDILQVPFRSPEQEELGFIAVTGSSDGTIRLWRIKVHEMLDPAKTNSSSARGKQSPAIRVGSGNAEGKADATRTNCPPTRQIGSLAGAYETGNRIICLKAFVMVGHADVGDGGEVNGEALGREMDVESSDN
ncbi:hypothetical protein GP486_002923 [Trichoglossum hirsutum]|uniref:60S ribosome biogenesis protein Mak11 n=1 Tax=Trichoglossum hirsutum TaxID=265104 RepID=A0A9P8LEA4_9PEZI|nr:hypothetical protein GP486_002923 [Trichoglossum hirsutum]